MTSSSPSADTLLLTAEGLGRRIVEEAVWHRDRCGWVGADVDDEDSYGGYFGAVYRALGPDFYGGTSGIALFLAELYAATGEEDVRRTALGAIRQALARADSPPQDGAGGLHTGYLGVAFAAARVGLILDEEEILADLGRLLELCRRPEADPEGFDLISGKSGSILGFLALWELLDDPGLVEQAARLGTALLATAEHREAGYAWGSSNLPQLDALCGLSHGAAGAGYALLDLYAATREPDFRDGAERAFDYERSWYDEDARNWPDLRERPGQRARADGPRSYPALWCHGAPGIALSRLRAYEVLGDERYEAEARIGLETTAASLERDLKFSPRDFSLCHGMAGNADVLLRGAQVLGDDGRRHASLTAAVAAAGIELVAASGEPWPCGVPSGETPSLFLGLAGIGYFYLRVRDPKVASPLAIGLGMGRPSPPVAAADTFGAAAVDNGSAT